MSDNLPRIEDYDQPADLPSTWNTGMDMIQDALDRNVDKADPSASSGADGYRRITISTDPPTGGADGDVWLQRVV